MVESLDYKNACEEAISKMDEEFWRGAEALYHHLQENIIGYDGNDAISLEALKFLSGRNKK